MIKIILKNNQEQKHPYIRPLRKDNEKNRFGQNVRFMREQEKRTNEEQTVKHKTAEHLKMGESTAITLIPPTLKSKSEHSVTSMLWSGLHH